MLLAKSDGNLLAWLKAIIKKTAYFYYEHSVYMAVHFGHIHHINQWLPCGGEGVIGLKLGLWASLTKKCLVRSIIVVMIVRAGSISRHVVHSLSCRLVQNRFISEKLRMNLMY